MTHSGGTSGGSTYPKPQVSVSTPQVHAQQVIEDYEDH
jgi:hypothetical protein